MVKKQKLAPGVSASRRAMGAIKRTSGSPEKMTTVAAAATGSKKHLASQATREQSRIPTESREILKANLGILMKQFPELDSQSKVANRSRVSHLTMGQIMTAGTTVTTDTLDKIAAAFNLKAWLLLNPEMEVSEKELKFYEQLIQKLDVLKKYD